MIFLARLISYIFHPVALLLPTPYLLVYQSTQNPLYAFKWTVFSCLFILFAGVVVVALAALGIFSDFDISKREQRPLLFVFSGIVAFFYLVGLIVFGGPRILYIALFGILVGIVALDFVNRFVKASIHTAVVSAFITGLSVLYGGTHLLALALIPLVGWARVKTRRHTAGEVIIGSIVGSVLVLAFFAVGSFWL